MEQKLCEAAITGNVESLLEIIEEDPLILDKVGYFDVKSPLHVAASFSQTDFVKELLRRKPELVQVLDFEHRSALHLASAKGHDEIVKLLIKARPQMCLVLDREGKNPVHVAAAEGETSVLEELVRTNRHAARVRLDGNKTILHLCVEHNQLESLKLLLEKIQDVEFVNAKGNDGNTILHLAILDKRKEMTSHILENKKIDVNAENASGHTAMDLLFLVDGGLHQEDWDQHHIEDLLRQAKAKRASELVGGDWLEKKKNALMIVASLIATIAFQVGVNPPGGVWQEKNDEHRAGEAVMAYNYPDSYPYFLRINTVGLVASLSTILLLISGLKFKNKATMWILIVTMWVAITSMATIYAFSITVVTPKKDRGSLSNTVAIAIIVWCSVMTLLLLSHTVRLVANVVLEKRSRNKAIARIINKPSWLSTVWSRLRNLRGLRVRASSQA